MNQANWLHAGPVKILKNYDEQAYKETIQKSGSDAVMTSKFIYKFNPDLSVLKGTLYLTLYPASQKLKKNGKCRYRKPTSNTYI